MRMIPPGHGVRWARAAGVVGVMSMLLALASSGTASAARFDVRGFHLTSSRLFVNEGAGDAVVTVERSDTSRPAQVRYITIGLTAQAPFDYRPVKSMLSFDAGQSAASFRVPIIDHGIEGLPLTIAVSLFGPSPIGMSEPSHAVLTILNNDPVTDLNPKDPLNLLGATVRTDPLAGASFFVDPYSEAAHAARRDPALSVIASQPGAGRFGAFSYPNAAIAVSHYLARAAVEQPGTIPMLTTYRLVAGHCGHWADPPSTQRAYQHFMERFARGIGSYRAVLFLEQDALITIGCLSHWGTTVRMAELRDAIDILTADCPHLVIYLDAGAADALPVPEAARLLRRAGVAKIQGFFLDSTHFDWTSREIRYGERISRRIGGKHFVVSTGESGRGPLVPPDRVHNGNEVLCNPPGRGLGPKPTTDTGYRRVDAFAWLDNPGGSSGACVPGAPPGGVYWPQYALMLIHNADFAVR
jgi:endoglucanase